VAGLLLHEMRKSAQALFISGEDLVERLKSLLPTHEQWLMERILSYARRQQYTKYTSTLVEAWRLSISGLSGAILKIVDLYGEQVAEFTPDEEYTENPIAEFGIVEARLHRKRGVSLVMFQGLMKYYRQTYQDLIREKIEDAREGARYGLFIVRCFDLLELAVTLEWHRTPTDSIIAELQQANRQLTNEKNRYLTFFESISDPVFLLSTDFLVVNCNVAAAGLLDLGQAPGAGYYNEQAVRGEDAAQSSEDHKPLENVFGRRLGDVLPWLSGMLDEALQGEEKKLRREVKAEMGNRIRHFMVIVSGMQDVSGKYEGAVVVVSEITDRKQLEEKILKLASTDPLTGVYNLRSFLEKAQAEIARARRYRHRLSVLMIDIDHFKNINDSYGHHTGNMALKVFSRTCLAGLRENDTFGRLGGEEFAAVLPETGEKRAFQVAERLRMRISQQAISHEDASFALKASIGIAALGEEDTKIEDILRRADQAMYSAKRQGRNRVVSASGKYQPAL
jgi:diguanylate cyclase (GGDEF)-like protein